MNLREFSKEVIHRADCSPNLVLESLLERTAKRHKRMSGDISSPNTWCSCLYCQANRQYIWAKIILERAQKLQPRLYYDRSYKDFATTAFITINGDREFVGVMDLNIARQRGKVAQLREKRDRLIYTIPSPIWDLSSVG